MIKRMNRRDLLKTAVGGMTAIALSGLSCSEQNISKAPNDKKLFLLRYDTETWQPEEMKGFLEKVIDVHREHQIPATFFCKGQTLDIMAPQFKAFYKEVKGDRLFDIQDHSYSHIGLGYTRGKPVEVLRADYERSFAAHERVFGVRPIGISICGTSVDGPSLPGFDATEKSRAELDMVASLGVKMINSFLTGIDGSRWFCNYSSLGHPEMMGFPSAYSDTAWMVAQEYGDPIEYIVGEMKKRAERNEHMPLMLHDWVAWTRAADQELTHVKKIVDSARKSGYELVTHVACLKDTALWS